MAGARRRFGNGTHRRVQRAGPGPAAVVRLSAHAARGDGSEWGRAVRVDPLAVLSMAVTIDDARSIAAELPRSYEALVRDGVRFRVGRIVYAAFSDDESIMGFGFPREEREALVASEPDKFLMPRPSEMRYRWVCVRLDALDVDELRELLVDAWRMCVPKKVAAAYDG